MVGETVDSHVHLWDARHTPQPWMTTEHEAINRPFSPEDIVPLLARKAIDRLTVVQGASPDSDTDHLFEDAARTEWVGAMIVWVCLDDRHRAAASLDGLSVRPTFWGGCHLTHSEPTPWILQALVLESVAMLEERVLILALPRMAASFRRRRQPGSTVPAPADRDRPSRQGADRHPENGAAGGRARDRCCLPEGIREGFGFQHGA